MKPPNGNPPANEVAAERAWLRAHGVPANEAAHLITTGKSRKQNADDTSNWLKDRPKGKTA